MAKSNQKQTKSEAQSIVKPLIQEGDKKHALESLFEGGSEGLPLLKSVGFGQVEVGKWISYVITSRGKEILSIEVSEPDQRPIAEDNAKTAFVTQLLDQVL